jgi:hypothetical protein
LPKESKASPFSLRTSQTANKSVDAGEMILTLGGFPILTAFSNV